MILEELLRSFPFLKSGFVHSSIFYVCLFFVSLALGLLVGMAFPKKSRSAPSARFVLACVFLTLAALFYTLLIFLCNSLFPLDSFLVLHASAGFSGKSYYYILLAIFVCGLLISTFWKIFLPLFVFLACLFTFFNHYLLFSEFGSQSSLVRITIEEDKIIIDGHEIQKTDGENQLELSVLVLPDTLPFPLRRSWFCIKNIPASQQAKNQGSLAAKILKNPPVEFYKNSILFKNRSEFQSPMPEPAIYPSLFSAQITFKEGNPTCTFKREL